MANALLGCWQQLLTAPSPHPFLTMGAVRPRLVAKAAAALGSAVSRSLPGHRTPRGAPGQEEGCDASAQVLRFARPPPRSHT